MCMFGCFTYKVVWFGRLRIVVGVCGWNRLWGKCDCLLGGIEIG